ncbi:MAG: hypothetical protein M1388_01095 [Thaumarchaeota archaeon]|nr:hypothetical protein [Nitrososphaerota archaeon]
MQNTPVISKAGLALKDTIRIMKFRIITMARESGMKLALILTVFFTVIYLLVFGAVQQALIPLLGNFAGTYTGYFIFAIFAFIVFWVFFELMGEHHEGA